MPTGRVEFLHVNQFTFSIDGVTENHVHKIDGLHQSVEVAEYRYGDRFERGLQAARLGPFDVTVTKDVSVTDEIYKWRDRIKKGFNERKTISIGLVDRSGKSMGEYQLYNCLPTSWSLGALNAGTSGHATETVIINVEKLIYKPA
ncbi:MAG: phage tail protein [Deltaproteobacteria bacterium]|nr:MAG: phage tail protein [Deltaproteobacteria bacterium]